MTIYRDLESLVEDKIVRKVKNGVTSAPSTSFESDFMYRLIQNRAEKGVICQTALSFIQDDMTLFLDDSTTALTIIPLLRKFRSLTVITSCIHVLEELSGIRGFRLIVLGGEFSAKYQSCFGHYCVDTISQLHADLCLISPHSCKNGLIFEYEEKVISVKKAMMNQSDVKILLVDHTKFFRSTLYVLDEIKNFDKVIIDSGSSAQIQKEVITYNINLLVANSTF